MSILAVILGIIAIILYFYACVERDRYNQLHELMELNLVHANTLLDHCDALEERNAWLEGERCQYRAMMAVAMLHLPTQLQATNKMTAKDGVEVP